MVNEKKNKASIVRTLVRRWTSGQCTEATDALIEEAPVALVYNGISHVVMMASPIDLEDFALGFSLTEGIIQQPSELREIKTIQTQAGIELQLTISPRRLSELKSQRRNLTGRTGCGLCGAESLTQAIKPLTPLSTASKITDDAIQKAAHQLTHHQPLQLETGAFHGAAWCQEDGQILIGRLSRDSINHSHGFVLISSRASYEMVHKAANAGIHTLVAVSAPTSLAVQLAKQANLNLVGFARAGRHVYYTHDQPLGGQTSD